MSTTKTKTSSTTADRMKSLEIEALVAPAFKVKPKPTAGEEVKSLVAAAAGWKSKTRDVFLPREQFRAKLDAKGQVVFGGHFPLLSAVKSITDFAKMPDATMTWLLDRPSEEVCKVLNDHFDDTRAFNRDQFMLRLRQEEGKGEVLRYVASESYTVVDHSDVLEVFGEALDKLKLSKDAAVLCRSVRDNLSANILFQGTTVQTADGEYSTGVCLRNNEVGQGSVRILPFNYRHFCRNGAIFGRNWGEVTVKIRHTRRTEAEKETIAARLGLAIEAATQAGGKLTSLMLRAREAKLVLDKDSNLERAVVYLSKKWGLSKPMAVSWLQAFQEEEGNTPFHLVQGLTRAAQEYAGDDRFAMEVAGGSMLAPTLDANLREIMSFWGSVESAAKLVKDKAVEEFLFVGGGR